jgi:hypothetical protein
MLSRHHFLILVCDMFMKNQSYLLCMHYDEITTLCSRDEVQRHCWQNFTSAFKRHWEGELTMVTLLRLLNYARICYCLSFSSGTLFHLLFLGQHRTHCLFYLSLYHR